VVPQRDARRHDSPETRVTIPRDNHAVHERAILSLDTSPEAERRQIEIWRAMSTVEKAQLVSRMTIAVQQLALAGIRERHPGASEREVFLRLAAFKLGPELVRKVYPDAASMLGPEA
jgi:hypothetical protein